jgi:hypothetical protein
MNRRDFFALSVIAAGVALIPAVLLPKQETLEEFMDRIIDLAAQHTYFEPNEIRMHRRLHDLLESGMRAAKTKYPKEIRTFFVGMPVVAGNGVNGFIYLNPTQYEEDGILRTRKFMYHVGEKVVNVTDRDTLPVVFPGVWA